MFKNFMNKNKCVTAKELMLHSSSGEGENKILTHLLFYSDEGHPNYNLIVPFVGINYGELSSIDEKRKIKYFFSTRNDIGYLNCGGLYNFKIFIENPNDQQYIVGSNQVFAHLGDNNFTSSIPYTSWNTQAGNGIISSLAKNGVVDEEGLFGSVVEINFYVPQNIYKDSNSNILRLYLNVLLHTY